jgi:hypothetical protein
MPQKKSDTKTLIRMLPDLLKLGVVTEEGAAKLREAADKGLLPKTRDGQRRLVRSIRESTDGGETQARARKNRAVLNAKKAAEF